jgi:hypothetical protein
MIERMKERFPIVRPLLVPAVLYIGLGLIVNHWLVSNPNSGWRNLVALLPMIPGLFLVFGIVRAIQRLDELSRKIILDSVAVSFMATLILVISLGYLGLAGLVQPNGVYISLFMLVVLLISKLIFSHRYQ